MPESSCAAQKALRICTDQRGPVLYPRKCFPQWLTGWQLIQGMWAMEQ